jgi:hypothetical protein
MRVVVMVMLGLLLPARIEGLAGIAVCIVGGGAVGGKQSKRSNKDQRGSFFTDIRRTSEFSYLFKAL